MCICKEIISVHIHKILININNSFIQYRKHLTADNQDGYFVGDCFSNKRTRVLRQVK